MIVAYTDKRRLAAEKLPALAAITGADRTVGPDGLRTPISDNSVEAFIIFLAQNCDGGIDLDYKGFSTTDAPEGHRLAAVAEARGAGKTSSGWSADERLRAMSFVYKYRRQLVEEFGETAYQRVSIGRLFQFGEAAHKTHHVIYNDESRRFVFNLSVKPMQVPAVTSDLWKIVDETNVVLNPKMSDFKRRAKSGDLDVSFYQGSEGARGALTILQYAGFVIDRRARAVLGDATLSYLRVKPAKLRDYERPMLCGYLHTHCDDFNRKDAFPRDLWRAVREVVSGAGAYAKEVDSDYSDIRTLRFPFGDSIVSDLEWALQSHRVADHHLLRRALNSSQREHQLGRFLDRASPTMK